MAMVRFLAGMLLGLLLTAAGAQEFVPVPPLQTRVTDKAGMLADKLMEQARASHDKLVQV